MFSPGDPTSPGLTLGKSQSLHINQ